MRNLLCQTGLWTFPSLWISGSKLVLLWWCCTLPVSIIIQKVATQIVNDSWVMLHNPSYFFFWRLLYARRDCSTLLVTLLCLNSVCADTHDWIDIMIVSTLLISWDTGNSQKVLRFGKFFTVTSRYTYMKNDSTYFVPIKWVDKEIILLSCHIHDEQARYPW